MTQIFVRPDVRAFLDMLAANPRPTMTAETLPMMRPLAPAGMALLDAPVGTLAVMRDLSMPGPGRPIALRLFDAREERGPGPVAVFFHGGGFVIGNIDTHASMCAEIARRLDVPVVSVDYRLAPEHPWPAAVDDAEAAARWVAANGAALDREVTGLILCGDSAGANLTIVAALDLRDRPAAVPVLLQMPIYPAIDPYGRYASGEAFGVGYGLDATDMAFYNAALRPPADHPRAVPKLANLTGIAPLLLVTAGLDPLRDQGRAYAAQAIAAGVPTTYREFAGTIHGFAGFRRAIPSAEADFVAILDVAKAMLTEFGAPSAFSDS